jgi:hypothetical protein
MHLILILLLSMNTVYVRMYVCMYVCVYVLYNVLYGPVRLDNNIHIDYDV